MIFEPVSYDHAAYLIGKRPYEVSRDADLLASAHLQAMKTYGYYKCVVGLDIYNIESEVYGCKVVEPAGNEVPSVKGPILEKVEDIFELKLNPAKDGRIPIIFEAAEIISQKNQEAEIRIPLSGPFTIASHLMGMEDIICELLMNIDQTKKALMHLAKNQLAYGIEAIKKGYCITLFESSVTPPLLSPELFRDCVFPSLKFIISELKKISQQNIQLIIGGDTVTIIDSICMLSPDYIICPTETNKKEFISYLIKNNFQNKVKVRVNMNPSVFLLRKQEKTFAELEQVVSIAEEYGNSTVGSILPFESDPNLVNNLIYKLRSS